MKKSKLMVSVLLMLSCLCSSVMASYTVTMYAPDGRQIPVNSYDVQVWKNVGWYDYPVTYVYAPDGRSVVISSGALAEWKSVGWYDYPVTYVYAPDGRTAVISIDALYDWCSVGWYQFPVSTLYSMDGRSIIVATSQVQAYLNVGWYTYQPSLTLPISGGTEFSFSSGAGAWGTVLNLYPDGTFKGQYHDSNMGETGYGYSNGTVYICNFSGKFGNIRKIDEYSYSMTLEYINTENIPGTEWITSKVRYVASEPYGLNDGGNFIFYVKNTPENYLPDGFKSWWGDFRFSANPPKALTGFGIYNVSGEYGFIN